MTQFASKTGQVDSPRVLRGLIRCAVQHKLAQGEGRQGCAGAQKNRHEAG
jgi:hypothetical protein